MNLKEYYELQDYIKQEYKRKLDELKKQYCMSSGKWGDRKGSLLPYAVRDIIKSFRIERKFSIRLIRKRIKIRYPKFKQPSTLNLSQVLSRMAREGIIKGVGRKGTMRVFRRVK